MRSLIIPLHILPSFFTQAGAYSHDIYVMSRPVTRKQLIAAFTELQEYYAKRGDTYRERALRAAISQIITMNDGLTTATDILAEVNKHKYPGIGKGITNKIAVLASGNTLPELIELQASPDIRAYEAFEGIVGVGPATIRRWISAGILSLGALRKAVGAGSITLNNAQRLGLHYYTDLNTRIPRSEVTTIGIYIKEFIEYVIARNTIDVDVSIEITGSYRRGHKDSGDIDMLVMTDPFITSLLHKVGTSLPDTPGYIDILSVGDERLTFLYRHRRLVRQVDILHVSRSSYPAALLYFTGSYSFNTMMRNVAKMRGYKLNQSGIYKAGRPLPVTREEDIFDIIGLKYVPPHQRS